MELFNFDASFISCEGPCCKNPPSDACKKYLLENAPLPPIDEPFQPASSVKTNNFVPSASKKLNINTKYTKLK